MTGWTLIYLSSCGHGISFIQDDDFKGRARLSTENKEHITITIHIIRVYRCMYKIRIPNAAIHKALGTAVSIVYNPNSHYTCLVKLICCTHVCVQHKGACSKWGKVSWNTRFMASSLPLRRGLAQVDPKHTIHKHNIHTTLNSSLVWAI